MTLAERLLPKDLPKRGETMVEVGKISPLVELCYAVRGFEKVAIEGALGGREMLRCDQILEMGYQRRSAHCYRGNKADACQIGLLVPLDMLFHALLQSQRDVYALSGHGWTGWSVSSSSFPFSAFSERP